MSGHATVKRFITPVSGQYGAPMGRNSYGILDNTEPGSVHLFKVPLDNGGYDSGGAYWGHGGYIYCATDGDGYRQFVRAGSRERAMLELGLWPYLGKMKHPGVKALLAYATNAKICIQQGRGHNSAFTLADFRDIIHECNMYLGNKHGNVEV